MSFTVKPPLAPMEAKSVEELPSGKNWQYEPKWDGFRCIVFRDRDNIYLQSKSGQPLARYFPDIVETLEKIPAPNFVLDGELAIPVHGALSFDQLQLRLHPAASRVAKLAREHPALFIVFDLLAEKGKSFLNKPLSDRRPLLEKFSQRNFHSHKNQKATLKLDCLKQSSLALSPATSELTVAKRWLEKAGGDLDGVMAKELDAPYASGERTAMVKIKRIRSADCVVGGFRYASGTKIIGSLLLGLYDDEGLLHHVGFTSAFKASDKGTLTKKFEALRKRPGFTGNAPGGPSRWSTERSGEWEPVAPKVVVEVAYDHFTGGRFRHGTKILRWRPDKAPSQCTMEQVTGREGKSLALL